MVENVYAQQSAVSTYASRERERETVNICVCVRTYASVSVVGGGSAIERKRKRTRWTLITCTFEKYSTYYLPFCFGMFCTVLVVLVWFVVLLGLYMRDVK